MYGIQFPTDHIMDHFLSSVCVWNIWIDVKLLIGFVKAGGSDRVCGITANEDAHILWWCIGRRPNVYLHIFEVTS